MKHTLLFILLAMLVLPIEAQRTTRRKLKAAKIESTVEQATTIVDTVIPNTLEAPAVSIKGYDKPLRSRRETFFASNNGKREICALAYTIRYYDTQDRLLHSASHNTSCIIPAGETRQLSIRSWDIQNAFYYRLSTVPERAAQATPYNVKISVDTVFLSRP